MNVDPPLRRAPPAALVIFGASGDLTRRKLLPAIRRLGRQSRLLEGLAVVGVARSHLGDAGFRIAIEDAVGGPISPENVDSNRYVAGGYDDPETYRRLADVLGELDATRGTSGNRLYYLATPPGTFADIVLGLGAAGLHRAPAGGFARIVIEKPYGHDLASSRILDDHVHRVFDERDVFRIDHYLAKETVQNLLALRFANSVFQPIWDRTWVDHLQITVAETLGVGTRGGFYESAGAIRDIVQNHVLQVLALALMEPPSSFAAEAIRNEKVKLLEAIRQPTVDDVHAISVRGQYRGYRGARRRSMQQDRDVRRAAPRRRQLAVGGRAALRADRQAPPARVTEVLMAFRRPPHLPMAAAQVEDLESDALVLRIQPDEGISLRFGAKVPGHDFRVRTASMEFSYGDAFAEESPEAYERLLLDALVGDPTLFIRSDEVEQSWRIVDPILQRWTDDDEAVPTYEEGSWGPAAADRLLEEVGQRWREPDLTPDRPTVNA